jgi:pimeloyl-ACP methyl ester carboxylesterase
MVALATHRWAPTSAGATTDAVPPLAVLVHGVTGWHRTWWRVAPALATAGWQVIAIDQRGHGHSPRIDGTVTVGDLADDLAAVIVELGGHPDLLVGHSLGGAVAAELAFTRPELVDRLVLEDPPGISRVNDETWLTQQAAELAAARADPDTEVRRALAANPLWENEDARQDVEGKALADGPGVLDSFRVDIGVRVLDLLPRLSIPTLLLLADPARSVFPPVAREALRPGPGGLDTMVLDAGHTIHRDRFDDYVAAILAWAGR